MLVPIYSLIKDDSGVQGVFGDPPRVYPFGQAPQKTPLPYAVWQTVTGNPQNYLRSRSDMDMTVVQLDVYAKTADGAIESAGLLRNLLEDSCYVTSYRDMPPDPETKNYRFMLTLEFGLPR